MKDKIYAQYVAAFEKGVYNYMKEDFDPATQQIIPRKYFSGGVKWDSASISATDRASTSKEKILDKFAKPLQALQDVGQEQTEWTDPGIHGGFEPGILHPNGSLPVSDRGTARGLERPGGRV